MMHKSLFRASKRRRFIELFKEQSELSDIHTCSRKISCHVRPLVTRTSNLAHHHEFTLVAKSKLMFDCCYRTSFLSAHFSHFSKLSTIHIDRDKILLRVRFCNSFVGNKMCKLSLKPNVCILMTSSLST